MQPHDTTPHAPSLKRCPKCGDTKPLDRFSLNKNRPDGHSGHCKDCRNKSRIKVPRKSKPIEDRFWPKVKRGTPDECWEWQAKTTGGYGMLNDKGRFIYAHRLSYELHHGPIPDGMCICHHCDRRSCCNPAHLFLGTQADNNRDMTAKGRHGHTGSKGEKHPAAKLSTAEVIEIRTLHAQGITPSELSKRFGISTTHVHWIITRKSWKHI